MIDTDGSQDLHSVTSHTSVILLLLFLIFEMTHGLKEFDSKLRFENNTNNNNNNNNNVSFSDFSSAGTLAQGCIYIKAEKKNLNLS